MAPLRVGSVRWIRAFLLLLGTRVCYATWPQFDPGMTPQQRGMVDTAFLDAMYMARNVAYTWEPRIDPYFYRYFDQRDETFVRDIFRAIVNMPLTAAVPSANAVPQILQNPPPLSNDFNQLSIAYGDNPGIPQWLYNQVPFKCGYPGVPAFLVFHLQNPTQAWISMCDLTFKIWYSLPDTFNPPPNLRQIPGMTCNGLGSRETDYMKSPGAVLLHELMHWSWIFRNTPDFNTKIRPVPHGPGYAIRDYEGRAVGGSIDPFYDAQIRRLPDREGYSEALNNADNYVAFAMGRTWTNLCKKYFAPATSAQDYVRREHDYYQQNPQALIPPPPPSPPPGPVLQPLQPPLVEVKVENATSDATSPSGLPDDKVDCYTDESGDWTICY